MIVRPHDLLRLLDPAAVASGAPDWVATALQRAPWVVVRRSSAPTGLVAVGVRGVDRSQRCALVVPHGMIGDVVAPEDLAELARRGGAPAVRALADARACLDAAGMPWGPTGSVGFELATGVPTATAASDLDVVVRAPLLTPPVVRRLGELHDRLGNDVPVRVDCQVETTSGAVALAELVTSPAEVLLKTTDGPHLVPIEKLSA